MNDQELEILIHRIVGGWAIDYHVLMTAPALDAIETHLFEQSSIAIRAAVSDARRSERERCAAVADAYGCGSDEGIPAAEFAARYGQHENLAAAIRALD